MLGAARRMGAIDMQLGGRPIAAAACQLGANAGPQVAAGPFCRVHVGRVAEVSNHQKVRPLRKIWAALLMTLLLLLLLWLMVVVVASVWSGGLRVGAEG